MIDMDYCTASDSPQSFHAIRMRELSSLNESLRKLLENNVDARPTVYIVTDEVRHLFERECEDSEGKYFGQEIPKIPVATMFGIPVLFGGTEEESMAWARIKQSQGDRPKVVAL